MSNTKKPLAIAICLILIFTLALSACSNDKNLAAKVGSFEVSTETLDGVAAFLMYMNYQTEMSELPEEEQSIWKNQVLTYLCVEKEVLEEHFKSEKKDVIDNEKKEEIDESITMLYESSEGLEDALKDIGVTKEHIEYYYRAQSLYSAFVDECIEEMPPSEQDINAFYEENKASMISPAAVTASHILLQDAEHTDEKRTEMQSILDRVNNGEDFAELAKQFSDDGSAADGGNLGTFSQNGQMVAEFEAAAFALEPNQVSDIVETEFGFHIIKVSEKFPEEQLPIDDYKEDIIITLSEETALERLAELKEKTKIEYFVELDPDTGLPKLELDEVEGDASGNEELHDHDHDEAGNPIDADGNIIEEAHDE